MYSIMINQRYLECVIKWNLFYEWTKGRRIGQLKDWESLKWARAKKKIFFKITLQYIYHNCVTYTCFTILWLHQQNHFSLLFKHGEASQELRNSGFLFFFILTCWPLDFFFHKSNPSTYNGGAVVAMAGKNCVAIASDKRFGIARTTVSHEFPKAFQVTDKSYVGLPGLATDTQTLYVFNNWVFFI